MALLYGLAFAGLAAANLKPNCPHFTDYAATLHEPFSEGVHKLAYQRPPPECRTASYPEVEKTITEMKTLVKDPDLYRLFENTFPNTLDTTVAWAGVAEDNADEELSFIITGDINAEWLRDSSNQLQSYRSLLTRNSSAGSLAALYRGAINLQARYVRFAPHCNAFQPPAESQIAPADNEAGGASDHIYPQYPTYSFFECKYVNTPLSPVPSPRPPDPRNPVQLTRHIKIRARLPRRLPPALPRLPRCHGRQGLLRPLQLVKSRRRPPQHHRRPPHGNLRRRRHPEPLPGPL